MSRSRDIANLLGSSSIIVDKTIIDAKGDLLIGSADNTVTKLAAGSTGQLPLVDSSTSSGLRYVDPPENRNLIINGAMQVHQRGTSAAPVVNATYNTADRWRHSNSGGGVGAFTESVESDAPAGSGFSKSLKLLCTTAEASPAANARRSVNYMIEGQDLQRVKKGTASAEQMTFSFWVKSNVTGTYILDLQDWDNTRQVSAAYSIAVADTWERKTVTFPADTTGAFDNDNALSLIILWHLAAGSGWTSGTLATAWESTTTANRAVGQTNLAAATDNYWQITGVQLEVGPVATPFEFEPYEATLRKCLRYYQRFNVTTNSIVGEGWAYNTTNASIHIPARPPMRAVPTVLDYSNLQLTDNVANNYNATSATIGGITGVDMLCPYVVVASGLTQYRSYALRGSNDGYIAFGAEL